MGTIAARDASRVIVLTEQVVAALCCASVQAIQLKGLQNKLSPVLTQFQQWVLESFTFVEEDRPLQRDLAQLVQRLEQLQLLQCFDTLTI